jgi:hypothetical protein
MSAIWKSVTSRLSDLDGLGEAIDKEAQQNGRGAIGMSKALILDNNSGHLRPIDNSDHSLAPNEFMLLEYQRDLVRHTSTLVAFESQASRRKVFSCTFSPQ